MSYCLCLFVFFSVDFHNFLLWSLINFWRMWGKKKTVNNLSLSCTLNFPQPQRYDTFRSHGGSITLSDIVACLPSSFETWFYRNMSQWPRKNMIRDILTILWFSPSSSASLCSIFFSSYVCVLNFTIRQNSRQNFCCSPLLFFWSSVCRNHAQTGQR